MTAPDPIADSDRYPYARDFDQIWHVRKPGTPWLQNREDGANAETLCGRWIPSVSVGEFLVADAELCADCDEAAPS